MAENNDRNGRNDDIVMNEENWDDAVAEDGGDHERARLHYAGAGQEGRMPEPVQPVWQWDAESTDSANLARALGALVNDRHRHEADPYHMGKPNKSPPTLTEPTPEAFYDWADMFRNAVCVNQWSHRRARVECRDAMRGNLAHMVRHIPVGDGDRPVRPWGELLEQYREAVVPSDAVEVLKEHALTMRQHVDESINSWFGRISRAWQVAYDETLTRCQTTSFDYEPCTLAFINGLVDTYVMRHVRMERPRNLHEAKALAIRIESTHNAQTRVEGYTDPSRTRRRYAIRQVQAKSPLKHPYGPGGSPDGLGSSASSRTEASANCYRCGEDGHYARDCSLPNPSEAPRKAYRGRGSRPAYQGRGGARGQGRGRFQGTRQPQLGRRVGSASRAGAGRAQMASATEFQWDDGKKSSTTEALN